MSSKYDHEVPHHDPSEGFDPTEPEARSITAFVVVSLVTLVVVIGAIQMYFNQYWNEMVEQKVLSVPGAELQEVHNLENWRMTHYEYTDPSKTTVRIPLDQARTLVLEDAAAGRTFYPAKPTEPKPETPAAAATPAPAGQTPAEPAKQ